jgi:hypothetical protein
MSTALTNLENLVTRRFPGDVVYTPDGVLLDKDLILVCFTDPKIDEYARTTWADKDLVSVEDFADFIINHTQPGDFRSSFVEYMDFIIEYYDVHFDVYHRLPASMDIVHHDEYVAMWTMHRSLTRHPILMKHPELLMPTYTTEAGCMLALYEAVNVVVLIKGAGADGSDAGVKALLNKREVVSFNAANVANALKVHDKVIELRDKFVGAAIDESEAMCETFYGACFKDHVKGLISELDEEIAVARGSDLDELKCKKTTYLQAISQDPGSLMHKTYVWKTMLKTSEVKEIIDVEEIAYTIGCGDMTSISAMFDETRRMSNAYADKRGLRVNWEGVAMLVLRTNVLDRVTKEIVLECIVQAGEIWVDMMIFAKQHADNMLIGDDVSDTESDDDAVAVVNIASR